jgi:hypothetical protein
VLEKQFFLSKLCNISLTESSSLPLFEFDIHVDQLLEILKNQAKAARGDK